MDNRPILIVDDEPENLAAMRQVLSPNHELVFARSGKDALRAAIKHNPAMILLDIQMPDMDGYSVCRALKKDKHTENIPVIFISALSEIGDEAAGFEVGGVDYITKPISPEIVRARVRTHLSLVRVERLEKSYRDAIYMLGEAGHYRDYDTGVHIWRMAAYSRALAVTCGWTDAACNELELAATMHDTGKLGIPDAILQKAGTLDAGEWAVMKTHTRIGYDILNASDAPLFKLAATVALRHHEKWDGNGYPDGLAGELIPESARIVAVADVFDALTMQRPYKPSWTADQAMENIKEGSGNHFEPRLVENFIAIMPQILEIKAHWDNEVVTAGMTSSFRI